LTVVIDIHTHPAFFEPICEREQQVEARRLALGLYKAGPASLQHIFNQMTYARIDRIALLPLDLTNQAGIEVVSNAAVKSLVLLTPERFIGFASVDPQRVDAAEVLEDAFGELGLAGLKLHPARQKFIPSDERYNPLYEICLRYNRPVIFHAGMSLQPDAPSWYAHPAQFEALALRYPRLRICWRTSDGRGSPKPPR